jgi:tRNA(Ile)-lysidine synthase
LSIVRAGLYPLPGWGGSLRVVRVREGGVPLAWLARLELRERGGGEQFQAGLGRPPRSLKKQFQAQALPAWERSGPLVFSGGQLVFVPGLGLDARVLGLPGQPLVQLSWERKSGG